MTVTNETRSVRHQGDTVTTLWSYTFLIPTATEILVRVYDTSTSTWTTISDSNYTLTGVGNASGGTLTYPTSGSPMTATQFLYISRVVGYTQDMSISENSGYDSSVLEAQLDDLVFQIQQVKDAIAGAPTLQAPDAFTETLPPIDDLKGKLLIFDTTTGNPKAGPTADNIADAETNAAAAAASATAAATSATNAAASATEAQTAVSGLKWKSSVKVSATGNITLSGIQTVDGVALSANDRALVPEQTAPEENGIYLVSAGAWTRATDSDTWDELVMAVTAVEEGTTRGGRVYRSSAATGGTLGTTAIPWSEMVVAEKPATLTAPLTIVNTSGTKLVEISTAGKITAIDDVEGFGGPIA